MFRRSLLIAGIGLLPSLGCLHIAQAGEAFAAPVPESDRVRLDAVLAKKGYRLAGDLRRKGSLISTIAERDGRSWRLVLDGANGDIVGRRAIATSANLAPVNLAQ
jgi:hypothetical protein